MTEREHQTMRKFRRGDIPAVVIAIALAAFFLFGLFKYPNPDQQRLSNFGPEWKCYGVSKGGASFCIRKSVLNSANQTVGP